MSRRSATQILIEVATHQVYKLWSKCDLLDPILYPDAFNTKFSPYCRPTLDINTTNVTYT